MPTVPARWSSYSLRLMNFIELEEGEVRERLGWDVVGNEGDAV